MAASQQILLGQGASKKTYVEDVFSTYVYKGTNTGNTITNGIDNSKGGLLWTKARTVGESHTLFDTERASNKAIYSNGTEGAETRNFNLSFLSDGFSWNTTDGMVNNVSHTYAAWNFRKAKGFFTCMTYTGNATNRGILHDLGSQPGMMIIKKTSGSDPWYVWHKGLSNNTKTLSLDSSGGESGNASIFNSTAPTATQFYLGTNGHSNENNHEYICYLFADDA